MKNNRLQVAIVGLGIGMQHAQAFLRTKVCDISYLFDLDEKKAKKEADQLAGCKIAQSFSEVIADKSIDIVVIASYDDAHYEQVRDALQCGKHVFVEKPLCRTGKELEEIKALWQSKNLVLASNHILQSAPLYQWLKAKVEQGDFGKIFAVEGQYLYGRLTKITEGWRKDVVDYSVILGGGIHIIDLFFWILREKPTTVRTLGNRIATEGTAFRYSDFVQSVFQYKSGMVATVTANFACVHPHQHILRIFGTEATFLYDDAGPRMFWSRDPKVPAEKLVLSPLPKSKGELIPGFVEAVLKKTDLSGHAKQVFDVLGAAIAAEVSLLTSREVTISTL